METKIKTICMTKEFWVNSQFSIARQYGQIRIDGHVFIIVNKYGQNLFEVSIPPTEPADLVRQDFIPFYKRLGRKRFLEAVLGERYSSHTKLKKILKQQTTKIKPPTNTTQLELF